ncbi:hypothetical protein GF376_00855 [Candidatus Peregrinibacteria bacterium]|nr:hypothetical protein [Candidatus Peregrinibacteria bacterium]
MQNKYSLENLKKLMAKSESYQELSDEIKSSVEKQIKNNNKPVLMYIYYQLLDEENKNNANLEELSKKITTANQNNFNDLQQGIKKQLF